MDLFFGKSLYELCEEGDEEKVSAAFEDGWIFSGEDPNSRGGENNWSCLMVAAVHGHVGVVEKLLSFPSIIYLDCYLLAQQEENELKEEIKALLEAHHQERCWAWFELWWESHGCNDILSFEDLPALWKALFGSGKDGEGEEGCLVTLWKTVFGSGEEGEEGCLATSWATVSGLCGSSQEEEEEEKRGEEGPGQEDEDDEEEEEQKDEDDEEEEE